MGKTSQAGGMFTIGVDIESVNRFETRESLPSFFIRTFTERERAYCESKANPSGHFAGTFAAKEAALKAMAPLGLKGARITDFEVAHGKDGAPKINYVGRKLKMKSAEIRVSISHTRENAVAVALVILAA